MENRLEHFWNQKQNHHNYSTSRLNRVAVGRGGGCQSTPLQQCLRRTGTRKNDIKTLKIFVMQTVRACWSQWKTACNHNWASHTTSPLKIQGGYREMLSTNKANNDNQKWRQVWPTRGSTVYVITSPDTKTNNIRQKSRAESIVLAIWKASILTPLSKCNLSHCTSRTQALTDQSE